MSSRNILIIAIILLFVIVGVGLYFLFFGSGRVPVTITQTGQAGSLPNAGNQSNPNTGSSTSSTTSTALAKNFGVISSEPILDYFVNNANVVTAIEPSGKIVQVANGQVATISTLAIQNILYASFSYDGSKILVSFGNASNTQTSIFNVASTTWTPLAAGLQSLTWSPSDYRVAYYIANAAQGTETFATIDTSRMKLAPIALETLHAQDLTIAWPLKNQIIISTKPSAYVPGSVWALNLSTSALTPIALETPGLATLWSGSWPLAASSTPMGLQFSSGGAGLGGSVALTDSSGNILQQLNFVTLPSKCLFSSATSTPYLYCGFPRDSNTLSISHLPDDYNEMALFTSDDIYRVNLQTGAINPVFNDQSQNLDVSDMKFFNNTLFFVNRYDNKLYGVQL